MALSQRKTTIAVLRGILGPIHGQADNFARLAKRSRSWVKKVSAGAPLTEDTARLLELETGVSLVWLMGPPDAPPVNGKGQPYTSTMSKWYRARKDAGKPWRQKAGFPFNYAPLIAAIGSAAGDKGEASLFLWRLQSFLDQCKKEFGYDGKAHTRAKYLLHLKAPELEKLAFHDKGLDSSVVDESMKLFQPSLIGATGALKKLAATTAPGESSTCEIMIPSDSKKQQRS